jgi:hypothetical protein
MMRLKWYCDGDRQSSLLLIRYVFSNTFPQYSVENDGKKNRAYQYNYCCFCFNSDTRPEIADGGTVAFRYFKTRRRSGCDLHTAAISIDKYYSGEYVHDRTPA